MPIHEEQALEYLIQAFVIYEKISGTDSPTAADILRHLYGSGEKMSHKKDILDQRLAVQRDFLHFRYNESIDGREEELIRYFES